MKVKHKSEDPIYTDRRRADHPTRGYISLPERIGRIGELARSSNYIQGRLEHNYHSRRLALDMFHREEEFRYDTESRGGEHNEFEYQPILIKGLT